MLSEISSAISCIQNVTGTDLKYIRASNKYCNPSKRLILNINRVLDLQKALYLAPGTRAIDEGGMLVVSDNRNHKLVVSETCKPLIWILRRALVLRLLQPAGLRVRLRTCKSLLFFVSCLSMTMGSVAYPAEMEKVS